jgi:hypothetical protein
MGFDMKVIFIESLMQYYGKMPHQLIFITREKSGEMFRPQQYTSGFI